MHVGSRITVIALAVFACQARAEPPVAEWIDATATLDSATTPVYAGDAPMSFTFLKDMRRGDPLTLSMFSLGAHLTGDRDQYDRRCSHAGPLPQADS